MRQTSFFKKLAALFVLLAFATNGIQPPAYSGQMNIATPVIANPSKDQATSIPSELGKIEESFQGFSGKTIIYIQDAHDSIEAQENIAKMIEYFVEHHGVKTVFEEGYEGTVPTDKYFGLIKGQSQLFNATPARF